MNQSSSPLPAAPWWYPRPGRTMLIRGGRPLLGTWPVSGAKNAVLPLMVSALLTPHLVTLHNVPASLDVAVLSALLRRLGAVSHHPGRSEGPWGADLWPAPARSADKSRFRL